MLFLSVEHAAVWIGCLSRAAQWGKSAAGLICSETLPNLKKWSKTTYTDCCLCPS